MVYPTGMNMYEAPIILWSLIPKIDSCNTLDFVILDPKVWCCKNSKDTYICESSVYQVSGSWWSCLRDNFGIKIKLGISSLLIIRVSAASQICHCLNKVSNWLPFWPYLDVVRRFCLSGDDVIKLKVLGVLLASSVFPPSAR